MVALIDSELDHSISSTTGSLARLPVEDTPSTTVGLKNKAWLSFFDLVF
jgi:hypothetical protein